MAKMINTELVAPDPEGIKASSQAEYAERGWLFLSHKKFDRAIEDFRHVVGTDSSDLDSWFGLGLSLKAAGDREQALDAFEHVLELVSKVEDKQSASVLSRLAKGHINQIKTGDWNLAKEVWKTVY
jgi:tetratricopeptide (TPR) repeat protein